MIIQLIGARRATILGIAIVINAILAGLYFFVLEPMQVSAQSKLSSTQAGISDFQRKIQGIKKDVETYKVNLPIYEGLQATGFTMEQDRFEMGRTLEAVQKAANVAGFAYTIDDIRTVNNTNADAAQMKLLASRIKLDKLGVVTDADFFNLLEALLHDFPAQLRLDSFNIQRSGVVNADALQKISSGGNVNLITADAAFDWLTLVPKTPEELAMPPGGKR